MGLILNYRRLGSGADFNPVTVDALSLLELGACVLQVSLSLLPSADWTDETVPVSHQVVFNMNNGAGRVSVRSTGQMLCDGQWHHLLARKTKHVLILSVDGQKHTTPNPYPLSTSAETNNPVYLGGYPGENHSTHAYQEVLWY